MELRDIFYDCIHRNIFLSILSYMNYNEISNLLFLDKHSKQYVKAFLENKENESILKSICLKRYFECKKMKFYVNKDMIIPSSSLTEDKSWWRGYYRDIDDGDIIYLNNSDKFIKINSSKIFIRHIIDDKHPYPTFPIDYWREVGRQHPFRLWIVAYVFYDSLEEWMKNKNIRFIDIDLNRNLYSLDVPIQIYFTYVEEIIYIYKGN